MTVTSTAFISPEALLSHWQGHRRLSRRVIEVFPEDKLFSFSIGGMRPFGALALEMISMAVPTVRGIVSGEWNLPPDRDKAALSKPAVLEMWDESTTQLDTLWSQIPPGRFFETMTAFGQYTGLVHDLVLYIIDNEIHHRAQGYVYLRALGIAPPPFYERA